LQHWLTTGIQDSGVNIGIDDWLTPWVFHLSAQHVATCTHWTLEVGLASLLFVTRVEVNSGELKFSRHRRQRQREHTGQNNEEAN
jgi:hypothetical protein